MIDAHPARRRIMQVGMLWKIAIGLDVAVAQLRARLTKFEFRKYALARLAPQQAHGHPEMLADGFAPM